MRHSISIVLTAFCMVLQAQPPSNYYDQAEGKEGNELLYALHEIIENPGTVSYGSVDETFVQLGTDEDPNNSSNIILFYTRDSRPSSSFTGNGDGSENTGGWNKEHVWPRSRGVGESGDDQQDMHMLRPTDVDINSRRGNKDFGEVSGNNTSNSNYFEPHDDVKGDVARILFYMITCYQGSLELVESVTNSSNQLGNLSLMLQWHEDDPVDSYEENRNDVVYSRQGNRNPFIDHPGWIDCIWGSGNCSDDDEGGGGEGSEPALITIEKTGFDSDFGEVSVGANSGESKYSISGTDLPDDILVTAPTDFEISLTSGSGFTGSLSLPVDDKELTSTDIYVRFSPSREGVVSRFISHIYGQESEDVILTGKGVDVVTQSKQPKLQSIYPNPASGIVKLEHLNFPKQALKLFDSSGRRMPLNWTEDNIDVSGYQNGIYYLILPVKEGPKAFRILVQ